MKKQSKFIEFWLSVHTVYVVACIIICAPIYLLERVFVSIKYSLVQYYKQSLLIMPQYVRVRLKSFDAYGLRHNSKWLEENVAYVAKLPIHLQAEYADRHTVSGFHSVMISRTFDFPHYPNQNPSELTATAIGNIAYLLHYEWSTLSAEETECYKKHLIDVKEYWEHWDKK